MPELWKLDPQRASISLVHSCHNTIEDIVLGPATFAGPGEAFISAADTEGKFVPSGSDWHCNRIQSSYNSEGAGSSHLHSRSALTPTSPVSENESHAFDPMHYRSSSFKLIRIFVINVNHKEIDTQSKPTHDAQRSTSERRRHEPSISPNVRDQREERLGGTQIITHLAFVF